jgi:hypothetical protein
LGALHPDSNPGYGGGRISSNNIGVIMEKITDRTKIKRRENRGRKLSKFAA